MIKSGGWMRLLRGIGGTVSGRGALYTSDLLPNKGNLYNHELKGGYAK